MNCSCIITNLTGSAIAQVVLYHAPGMVGASSFHTALCADNLGSGEGCPPGTTDQKAGELDYWSLKMQVQVGGETLVLGPGYLLGDVPRDGSINVMIGQPDSDGCYPVDFHRSKEREFGDDAGSIKSSLLTLAAAQAYSTNALMMSALWQVRMPEAG